MKKLYIIIPMALLLFITTCVLTINEKSRADLKVEQQKLYYSKRADIGVDKLTKEDSINYKEEVTDNKITITFDKFTGVALYSVDISNYDYITGISILPKGSVKLKFTQGDFMNSDLHEDDLSHTVKTHFGTSFDHLDKNEKLDVWVIGDNALNGSICFELYNK